MYQNVINASFFSVFVVSLLLTKNWNLQHQAQCLIKTVMFAPMCM